MNPDLLERVDTHVDTIVRLTSGTEYRVEESAQEIVRRIAEFRARVIALAGIFQDSASPTADSESLWAETANAERRGAAARLSAPIPVADDLGHDADAAPRFDAPHTSKETSQ